MAEAGWRVKPQWNHCGVNNVEGQEWEQVLPQYYIAGCNISDSIAESMDCPIDSYILLCNCTIAWLDAQ